MTHACAMRKAAAAAQNEPEWAIDHGDWHGLVQPLDAPKAKADG